jgi:protein-export membrane protein SecD
MKKNNPLVILLILAITGIAVWFLYPSVTFYMQSPEKRIQVIRKNPEVLKKVINLGLDLQGGMRLVLEIDRSKLKDKEDKHVLDRAYAIIENRINGLGVAEPVIQKQGNDRLIVELPGLKDEKAAKNVVGSTAQLEFKLVREPAELEKAIRIIDKVLKNEKVKDETEDSTTADTAITDTATVKDEESQAQAEQLFAGEDSKTDIDTTDTTGAQLETEEDIFAVTSFSENLVAIGQQIGVKKANRTKVEDILSRKDVQGALKQSGLGSSHFLWGHAIEQKENVEFYILYYVKKKAELAGDIIKNAQWEIAQGGMEAGQYVVSLEMNNKGARRWSRITGANINKFLAIVLDSTVYSAPVIRTKIPHGRSQITGSFTADVLTAGALPAPVKIIEERTVGPSLGYDSIEKATWALIIGFVLVVLFMIVYYKLAGIIANVALLLNLIFVLAIMASISATLTLPGIAGLILIMGMSIDANVIIFERIREELAIGKTIRSAVDAGYARAFVTIMDANITTLFTAFILMWVGTGPIKGFAVTMILGIIASLFTALFLTRVVFNFITASKNLKKLSI